MRVLRSSLAAGGQPSRRRDARHSAAASQLGALGSRCFRWRGKACSALVTECHPARVGRTKLRPHKLQLCTACARHMGCDQSVPWRCGNTIAPIALFCGVNGFSTHRASRLDRGFSPFAIASLSPESPGRLKLKEIAGDTQRICFLRYRLRLVTANNLASLISRDGGSLRSPARLRRACVNPDLAFIRQSGLYYGREPAEQRHVSAMGESLLEDISSNDVQRPGLDLAPGDQFEVCRLKPDHKLVDQ